MVDAMVKDSNKHLQLLEEGRGALESKIAAGEGENQVRLSTQSLAQTLKDYRDAASHIKKASAKPKPKAKKASTEPSQTGSVWYAIDVSSE